MSEGGRIYGSLIVFAMRIRVELSSIAPFPCLDGVALRIQDNDDAAMSAAVPAGNPQRDAITVLLEATFRDKWLRGKEILHLCFLRMRAGKPLHLVPFLGLDDELILHLKCSLEQLFLASEKLWSLITTYSNILRVDDNSLVAKLSHEKGSDVSPGFGAKHRVFANSKLFCRAENPIRT